VNNATVQSWLIVRGLIERQGSRFVITQAGRDCGWWLCSQSMTPASLH
jgi:hypothetical protein